MLDREQRDDAKTKLIRLVQEDHRAKETKTNKFVNVGYYWLSFSFFALPQIQSLTNLSQKFRNGPAIGRLWRYVNLLLT